MRILVIAAVLAVVGCEDEPMSSAAPSCAGGIWGSPELDAIAQLVLIRDVPALLASPSNAQLLERAARSAPAGLPPHARVALQNDAWGLVQRLEAHPEESEPRTVLLRHARALVSALASSRRELAAMPADPLPAVVREALSERDGWRERGSEMPVLGHERLFGLRRIFRVFEKPGGRALVSQLVALDPDGEPHLTSIAGEVEVLAIADDGSARGERILHLDRRTLRCDGPARALTEATVVAHLPAEGANGFLVELEPPIALRDNPCARCHEPGEGPMSLPTDEVTPATRRARLLDQLRDGP